MVLSSLRIFTFTGLTQSDFSAHSIATLIGLFAVKLTDDCHSNLCKSVI